MFYDIDKRVGKYVWLFEKKDGWDYNLKQDKLWLVESLNEPNKEHYDYFFVVTDGVEKREVIWHDTVVAPGNEEDEVLRVINYLESNGFYHEVWDEEICQAQIIRVAINWGDWKHDHGWCDSLMNYLGYEAFNEILTEENGSDCYSSEHIYVRRDNPKLEMLHALQKMFSE